MRGTSSEEEGRKHTKKPNQMFRTIDINGPLIRKLPGSRLALLAQIAVLRALIPIQQNLIKTLIEILLHACDDLIEDIFIGRGSTALGLLLIVPVLQDRTHGVLGRQGDDALVFRHLLPVVDEEGLEIVWHDDADGWARLERVLLYGIVSTKLIQGSHQGKLKEENTFSMSWSRARLVPRPGTEPRSSLSRAELRSDVPRFLAEGLVLFARRADSASRRRLVASSRLSSVALRRRSSRTQSSQLRRGRQRQHVSSFRGPASLR